MKQYVLDTSALISGLFNLADSKFYIPDSVVGEIQHGNLPMFMESISSSLNIMSPSRANVEAVKRKANSTGDLQKLSPTDIDVIALALETGSAVLSDDFAIQNVCSSLGIEFVPATIRPISDQVRWAGRCSGCGKNYSSTSGTCVICGHSIRRVRKKSDKIKK